MKGKILLLIFFLLIGSTSAINAGEIEDLRRDIILLNLINGLYLDSLQTRQLLSILYEAKAIKEEYQNQIEEYENTIKPTLVELREILNQNKKIPENIVKEVHIVNKMAEEARLRFQKKMSSLESRVIPLLTENQLYLIENFKPCMIPPKKGLIGQMPGQSSLGVEKLLQRIRKMPEWRYQMVQERLLSAHIDRLEQKFGILSEEEKGAERERVATILQKVRTLPEVDFRLQRATLAQEIIGYEPEALLPRKNRMGKVGRFLLDERLIPLLETRLETTHH